eukprot:GHRQ01036120.1.p1 GENE.GHRQ01036120.1~~GHRQ01036120.1.p1  ORF type:complete len:193 (+),score=63.26 GHRQ01036120.1:407-985(+)
MCAAGAAGTGRAAAKQVERQDVSNAMWGCAKLALRDQEFFDKVEAAAATWLNNAAAPALNQVAYACGVLQLQRPRLLARVIKRAQQLLSAKKLSTGAAKQLLYKIAIRTPATLGWAIAVLNMPQLAGDVRALVAAGIQRSSRVVGENARMLRVFHCWLVQQQLLDAKGLAEVLTPEQLAACEAEGAGNDSSV